MNLEELKQRYNDKIISYFDMARRQIDLKLVEHFLDLKNKGNISIGECYLGTDKDHGIITEYRTEIIKMIRDHYSDWHIEEKNGFKKVFRVTDKYFIFTPNPKKADIVIKKMPVEEKIEDRAEILDL